MFGLTVRLAEVAIFLIKYVRMKFVDNPHSVGIVMVNPVAQVHPVSKPQFVESSMPPHDEVPVQEPPEPEQLPI